MFFHSLMYKKRWIVLPTGCNFYPLGIPKKVWEWEREQTSHSFFLTLSLTLTLLSYGRAVLRSESHRMSHSLWVLRSKPWTIQLFFRQRCN